MRAFVLLLLLAPTLAAALPPKTPTPVTAAAGTRCVERGADYTSGKPTIAGPRRLGELPSANHYLAVDRKVDGCRKPIVVSTGIGVR